MWLRDEEGRWINFHYVTAIEVRRAQLSPWILLAVVTAGAHFEQREFVMARFDDFEKAQQECDDLAQFLRGETAESPFGKPNNSNNQI